MKTKSKAVNYVSMPLVNSNAAGIDIGSRFHFVAIGEGKENTRKFGVFTEDLHQIASYLKSNGIKSVAMESTGFYWKPLFVLLQDYGFEVILANAKHVKNVRGRKTDMIDCQWIQKLHSCGLLSASFQPDNFTAELRAYTRHRRNLIQSASGYISKMQKTLVLMNIQLSTVLDDLTGKTGQAILRAILSGERDTKKLADLTDPRVKASKETIAKSLEGTWRQEYLFELKQCFELYHYFWEKINECDKKIEALLEKEIIEREKKDGVARAEYKPGKKKRGKNAPKFDVDKYAYQLTDGIDLCKIDGVSYSTILVLLSEVGINLSNDFPTSKNFTSWLGLSPNNKISGGKVLSKKTEKKKNQLANALRQVANTIGNTKQTPLAEFFRRIQAKKGRAVAITATARKIATIIYCMLTKREQFNYVDLDEYKERFRKQRLKSIQKQINYLNITNKELMLKAA